MNLVAQPYPLWITEAPERDDLWDLPLDQIVTALVRCTSRVIGWTGQVLPYGGPSAEGPHPVVVAYGAAHVEARVIVEQESPVFYHEDIKAAVRRAFRGLAPTARLRSIADLPNAAGSSWLVALSKALGV